MHALRLVLLAPLVLLASGCYTVNSIVDAPDANPGDGVCARALNAAEARVGRRAALALDAVYDEADAGAAKLDAAARARIARGDLQVLGRPDLQSQRETARKLAGSPGATRDLASPTGLCTLRAAIMEANAHPWKSVITVPAGVYALTLPDAPAGRGGALRISRSLRLQGSGAGSTIIDGSGIEDTIAYVAGADVEINHFTLREANAFAGGALRVTGGRAELEDLVLRDNFAYSSGGGLLVDPDAVVRLRRSTISNNWSAFGGGIRSDGELWVHDTLISENRGNRGGGIMNGGDLNLRNVTISGNWADSPVAGVGGVYQGGFAFLNSVTITGNRGQGNHPGSWRGGGLQSGNGATTVVRNSILSDNIGNGGPNDCAGTLSGDSRDNLISSPDGCTIPSHLSTYVLGQSADLGPLQDNGGPTHTHLPGFGSPALNEGYAFPPPAAQACEPLDQRGVPRLQTRGVGCDLGAVELTSATGRVTGFMLVDAATDTDIRPLRHDDWLVLADLPAQLAIRATTSGGVGSVRFAYNGNPAYRTENFAPYALGGDAGGDYAPLPLAGGAHELRATPYLAADASDAAGSSRTIRFNVLQID